MNKIAVWSKWQDEIERDLLIMLELSFSWSFRKPMAMIQGNCIALKNKLAVVC